MSQLTMLSECYDDVLVLRILKNVQGRNSFYYHRALLSAADEVEAPIKGIYEFLSNIMWMEFDVDNFNAPFKPFSVKTETGTVRVDVGAIAVNQLRFIASLIDEDRVKDIRIKARLADILWLRKWKCGKYNPKQYAKFAIDTYMNIPLEYKDWVHGDGYESCVRALTLAMHIKDEERIKAIRKKLSKKFNELSDYKDRRVYDIPRILLLIKENLSEQDKIKIAHRLECMVDSELEEGLHSAIDWLDDVETWYNEAGLMVGVGCFSLRKVEWLEKWADNVMATLDDRRGNPFGVASGFYKEALIIAEHMPNVVENKQGVLRRLRLKMHEAQKKMAEKMRKNETFIDVSQLREEVIRKMTGVAHKDVLREFVRIVPVIGGVKSNISALDYICTKSICDGDGRTLRQIDGHDENEILKTNAGKRYAQHITLNSSAKLCPAYKIIKREHKFLKKEFDEIVAKTGFIPLNQRRCWTRALWHGWTGRFFEAALLIAPLMESLVRELLRTRGVKISRIEDGAEQYIALGTLMKECKGKDVISESLQFEIEALFCDNVGPNVRNVIAHGLFKDGDIDSVLAFYVWYFALRLVIDKQILYMGQSE